MSDPEDELVLNEMFRGEPIVWRHDNFPIAQLYRAFNCGSCCVLHNTCSGPLWINENNRVVCRQRLVCEGFDTPEDHEKFTITYSCGICNGGERNDEPLVLERYTKSRATLPADLEVDWSWLLPAYYAIQGLWCGDDTCWDDFRTSHPRLAVKFHTQFIDAARVSEDETLVTRVRGVEYAGK